MSMNTQWVIAEHARHAAELISAAKALEPGTVVAFAGGDEEAARGLIAQGADSAFVLAPGPGALWEDFAAALTEKAKAEQPSLILVGASKRGRSLAALLAANLDAPCISDGSRLALDQGRLTAERMVLGGLAMKTVSSAARTVIVTVSPGVYAAGPADTSRQGSVGRLESAGGNARVTGRRLREHSQVDLGAAARVVGVGRGFAEKEDLALAVQLAQAMGAELACSRPIAEFFRWMPEETYLGISGQVIKPEIYVAVGISGQPQHVFGIRDAKVIVSINKDENAPIHQTADYSIIGDLKEVLPLLGEAVSKVSTR